MIHTPRFLPALAAIGLVVAACGPLPTAPPGAAPPVTIARASRPLTLVASTPIVKDLVLNLTTGIQGVTVVSIAAAGGDPHEYEPTPADAKAVAAASALIVVGAQYEDAWLVKLLHSAGGQRPMIVAAEGVPLNPVDKAFNSEYDHDPHVWMDPVRWQQAAQNVASGIRGLDPAITAAVDANAAAYIRTLKQLDAQVAADTAGLPPARRVLVTTHDALGYYAGRYGFKIVGTVIPGASTSAAPSAQGIKRLVDVIKASQVKALFTEAGINPKLTEAVAGEAGVAIVDVLYVDTLSDAQGPAPTYLDMIRHDTRTIVNALK